MADSVWGRVRQWWGGEPDHAPLPLTETQIQALEDHAAVKQQEMFAPNQLAFDDRPAAVEFARHYSVMPDDQDVTPFRQTVDRMAEQTTPRQGVVNSEGQTVYPLTPHDIQDSVKDAQKSAAGRATEAHIVSVGGVIREQTKPHAWIAAEAARLRAEQKSVQHVIEAQKKDHSIGF